RPAAEKPLRGVADSRSSFCMLSTMQARRTRTFGDVAGQPLIEWSDFDALRPSCPVPRRGPRGDADERRCAGRAVAQIVERSVRPVSARAALHARARPEMAREARPRRATLTVAHPIPPHSFPDTAFKLAVFPLGVAAGRVWKKTATIDAQT